MNIYIIGNSMSKVQSEELAMLCDLFDHKARTYYTPNSLRNEFEHVDSANFVVVFEVSAEAGVLIGYARARGIHIIGATDQAVLIPDIEMCKSVAAIFAKVGK
ncbi:MAG: hypothetical protein AB7I44_21190 [Hyphomicrobiaceae bacterium]